MSKIEAIGGSKLEKSKKIKRKLTLAPSDLKKVEDIQEDIINKEEFEYLLSMSLWSLSQEEVDSLLKQKKEKYNEIEVMKGMKKEELWVNDIEEFTKCLDVIFLI
jgi:hypothetical protein